MLEPMLITPFLQDLPLTTVPPLHIGYAIENLHTKQLAASKRSDQAQAMWST